MASERVFGEIPSFPVGSAWTNRAEVSASRVHRPNQSGISGSAAEGADSIVVADGYEDDRDEGNRIWYTGAGGRDGNTGRQISDQSLDYHHNRALVVSKERGLPVRVVRGPRRRGGVNHGPSAGYRYDGLFRVEDYGSREGRSGFRVWMFELHALDPDEAVPFVPPENLPSGNPDPGRTTGVITRIVRSTATAEAVKRLHNHACQVCGARLEVPGGFVAEGAHIRALGHPHDGPDTPDNILCLCPNHHSMFDRGGLLVHDDLQVIDHLGQAIGPLRMKPAHTVSIDHLASHRARWPQS